MKPYPDLKTYLAEIIAYGGEPMTRAQVWEAAFKATGSRRAADMFAFGPRTNAKKADDNAA